MNRAIRPPCGCGAINGYWTTKVSLPGCSEYLCEDCLEDRLKSLVDWKVQIAACGGWADLKTSDGGEDYYVEALDYSGCVEHCNWMIRELEHDFSDLRIVRLAVPSEFDIY